jgi:hypothetical protein
MPKPISATPEQILMYGHISIALRKFLDSKGWGPGELNKAMGKSPGYSAAYQWVNGKSAPSPKAATKLSKVTGIPVEQLLRRDPNAPSTAIVTYKPSNKNIVGTLRPIEVLGFSVTNDGNARIKIDVTMPLESATPLLRMLLDAGLVFKTEE